MTIEAYSFGKMVYGGKTYTGDLIIYPDAVDDSWWRLQGHLLQMQDLENILKEQPDILVIGTGRDGMMRVPQALKEQLESRNIQFHAEPTTEAVKIFNRADKSKKVIAAFHLTC